MVKASPATPTVVATIPVGSSPLSVAYDSGMGEVFVANITGAVSVISDSSNNVVATIPFVGYIPPYGLGAAYDSGMGEIFVAINGGGTCAVRVISEGTNIVFATIPVGSIPYGVEYDSGKGEVLVSNSNVV